jgi:putative oxidoreductase
MIFFTQARRSDHIFMSTTIKSIDVTDAGHIFFASADSVVGSIKRNQVSIGARNLLIQTHDNVLTLIARVALGIVMFPHGAQKVFGWFGGHGFMGSMSYFTDIIHAPAPLAFLAILAEFAGSLGLITGCLSRIAAFGIACNMIVAIFTVHIANGFFMNWYGVNKGEGFEFHILALGLAVVVMIGGAGKASIDAFLSRKLKD